LLYFIVSILCNHVDFTDIVIGLEGMSFNHVDSTDIVIGLEGMSFNVGIQFFVPNEWCSKLCMMADNFKISQYKFAYFGVPLGGLDMTLDNKFWATECNLWLYLETEISGN
jgi:hypothetical protein